MHTNTHTFVVTLTEDTFHANVAAGANAETQAILDAVVSDSADAWSVIAAALLAEVQALARHTFHIDHVTIQLESEPLHDCPQC